MALPIILYDNILTDATMSTKRNGIIVSTSPGDNTTNVVNSSFPVKMLQDGTTADLCRTTTISGTVYVSTTRNNLITNGDIENVVKDGQSCWTTVSGTDTVMSVTRNTSSPLRDTADLKINVTTSGTTMSYIKSNYFNVTDNTYQLNFRAKATTNTAITATLYDRAGNSLGSKEFSLALTSSTHTWTPTILSENYSECYLTFTPQGISTINLDDILFAKVDSIDSLCIMGHNLHGTTITLYGSDSPYTMDTEIISAFTPNNTNTILKTGTGSTNMYYVLKIENTLQNVDISQLVISAKWQLPYNVKDGYTEYNLDLNQGITKTDTGRIIKRHKYSKKRLNATYLIQPTVYASDLVHYKNMVVKGQDYNLIWCYNPDTPNDTILFTLDKKFYTTKAIFNRHEISIVGTEV